MFKASTENLVYFRPTFFNYPKDTLLHDKHSYDNFMLGPSIIVHPVLKEGVDKVNAYFPNDVWYNFFTGKLVANEAAYISLDCPVYGNTNIHVRGGSIVPTFNDYNNVDNVYDLRKSLITLNVALNNDGEAYGNIIIDSGDSLDPS